MQYNNTMASLLKRGEPYDRESMKWEADSESRASWVQPEYKPEHIHIALGRVDGEENTRFGSIPRGADIAVGYLLDWSVHDIFGWGSFNQPRVESVTEIVIKEDYSATIEFINDIQMIATGRISWTANAAEPWPQQGEHDATLTAIDIQGNQHRLNIAARATAMPTNGRSNSNSQSSTSKWTVSGGVSASAGGPSANIGGSYEETQTVSSSQSRSSSVPTIPDAVYNKDYTGNATKTVKIDCGGAATVSRAVQINGHFFTKSFARGGSVSTSATQGVTNGLRIKITCEPCGDGGGDDEGTPADDPTGTDNPNNPITQPDADGYGSTTPDAFAPRERNGVTITPSHGGAADPSAWWNDPRIAGGGCIYIDPRTLPPFVAPVEQELLGDPDFTLPGDLGIGGNRIPLIVPRGFNQPNTGETTPLVPLGYLMADSSIEPAFGAAVTVNPGVNLVTIEGGFWVNHPRATGRDFYEGNAVIHFRAGSVVRINGNYRFAPVSGATLRVLEAHGLRLHQMLDETPSGPNTQPLVLGQVAEDPANPGELLFPRASDFPASDSAALPDQVDDRIHWRGRPFPGHRDAH